MPDLIESIRTGFAKKSIAVVGDLVADQFLSGTIARVSREAPVFIMRHEETVTLPGGAANAAANVAALGGQALLVGITGNDDNGSKLLTALGQARVDTQFVVVADHIPTTTKVRVLTGQHFAAKNQVIRIDYEPGDLPDDVSGRLPAAAAAAVDVADAIIISDYNYGVITRELFEQVAETASDRNIPVILDSRFRLEQFPGATSATPNREEVEQILGSKLTADDCEALRSRLRLRALIVTNGNKGLSIFEEGRMPLDLPAIGSLSAVDVTGAGDTVIAAYALGLACGMSFADAARLANHAGGIVVMKRRTATVSPGELLASIEQDLGTATIQQTR